MPSRQKNLNYQKMLKVVKVVGLNLHLKKSNLIKIQIFVIEIVFESLILDIWGLGIMFIHKIQ